MKDYLHKTASYYNADDEEERFIPPFKQLESINTKYLLTREIKGGSKVLDCATGTGVYIDCLKGLGCDITASDLSTRHVEIVKSKHKDIKVHLDNALDLSRHEDGYFDCVLCCGPLYHLSYNQSIQCVKECLKKTRDGGKVILAYMNKHFVGLDLMFSDYYATEFDDALKALRSGEFDKQGFYGCARFISPEEAERLVASAGGKVTSHVTVDADIPFFFKNMRDFTIEKVNALAEYVREIWHRPTMLGCGKHNLIVVTK